MSISLRRNVEDVWKFKPDPSNFSHWAIYKESRGLLAIAGGVRQQNFTLLCLTLLSNNPRGCWASSITHHWDRSSPIFGSRGGGLLQLHHWVTGRKNKNKGGSWETEPSIAPFVLWKGYALASESCETSWQVIGACIALLEGSKNDILKHCLKWLEGRNGNLQKLRDEAAPNTPKLWTFCWKIVHKYT